MRKNLPFIIFLFSFFSVTILISRSWRPAQIPNGNKFSCATCHLDPNGGGPRNLFGQEVEKRVLPGSTQEFWSASLAAIDSDGDGKTNGQELGDPAGTWRSGQPDPGTFSAITNPGDLNSTAVENFAGVPTSYRLLNNYPNPFNPSTMISFDIPQSENVSLKIFNINGELVRTITSENLPAGHFEKLWDGKNNNGSEVSSGIYFYRLIAGKFDRSARMLLMK
jgi:hypothetical protein